MSADIRLGGVTVHAPVAAGATRLDVQPNADHCLVYADPTGQPFCLSTWDGPRLD